jgi:hypothetical protein
MKNLAGVKPKHVRGFPSAGDKKIVTIFQNLKRKEALVLFPRNCKTE